MPPPLTKYQLRKHREALDDKYLEKQLVFLTLHKSEILHSIHQYRVKHSRNTCNPLVTIHNVSRLLNTNKRTIRLLAVNKNISSLFFSSYSLFSLNDIRDFIKSLPKD